MKFVENNSFNEYIESYKKLPLEEKKKLVEKQIEELLAVLTEVNKNNGKESEILYNREILDLKKESATESDFVEAMFVYLYTIKELLASIIDTNNK